MKTKLLGVIVAVAMNVAWWASPADAVTIDWTLSGVVFDDGGTASGTFATASATGDVTAFDITTTAGSGAGGRNGVVYNSSTVGSEFLDDDVGINSFLLELSGSVIFINLAFLTPLTTPGIDALVPLNDGSYNAFDCNPNCNYARLVVSGEAVSFAPATTPLPAALPLFAGGLGAMGLLGWRRKRKNTAAIAA